MTDYNSYNSNGYAQPSATVGQAPLTTTGDQQSYGQQQGYASDYGAAQTGYQQPGYQQGGYQQPGYQYQQPVYQMPPQPAMAPAYAYGAAPVGTKSKMAAGLLGIFFGAWGVHNFYLGYTSKAVVQIIVTLVTFGIGSLWGFIEGIVILCSSVGSPSHRDAYGYELRD